MTEKIDLLGKINQARFEQNYQYAITLQLDYLSIFEEDTMVMQNLALSYYHLLSDDFDYYVPKALEWINKAIALSPLVDEFYVTRADMLIMWGNYEQALWDIRKALELNPFSLSTILSLLNLISLPEGIVDFSEGIIALEKIMELHIRNAEIYNHLAWLYGKTGNTPKALFYVEQALKCKEPLDPAIL